MTLSRGPMVKLVNWLISGVGVCTERDVERWWPVLRERTAASLWRSHDGQIFDRLEVSRAKDRLVVSSVAHSTSKARYTSVKWSSY